MHTVFGCPKCFVIYTRTPKDSAGARAIVVNGKRLRADIHCDTVSYALQDVNDDGTIKWENQDYKIQDGRMVKA